MGKQSNENKSTSILCFLLVVLVLSNACIFKPIDSFRQDAIKKETIISKNNINRKPSFSAYAISAFEER